MIICKNCKKYVNKKEAKKIILVVDYFHYFICNNCNKKEAVKIEG